MLQISDERPSDSPWVDAIWRGQTDRAGSRIAPAGSCWVMLFEKRARQVQLSVVGPMAKAQPMNYEGDTEFLAVKFKPGTFMPRLPASDLLDTVITLPEAAGRSFWLDDATWQFPDYENVETFVKRLAREGALLHDRVVEAALQDQPLPLSPRSIQRRFLQITGLTRNVIRQIARARQAMLRLQQGASIMDTVFELGYTDQPHMTKSLKHFVGQTPAQLARQSQRG